MSGVRVRCPNELCGRHCPRRHLVDCHPERVALLYRYGRLSEYEANAWALTPCAANEMNPFSVATEKLCFDFVNTRVCKRNQEGKICRFRHCVNEGSSVLCGSLLSELRVSSLLCGSQLPLLK